MKNINKLILVSLLATFGLVACDSGNNPENVEPKEEMDTSYSEGMTSPEEQSDSMSENAGEMMDNAMEEGGQAMDEMEQTMEDAASEAEETLDDMTNPE